LKTIIILIVIAVINIFFGYWRSNTRKLTFQWILAIHVPVPIAIILRLSFLGWNWMLLPAFIGAFALGQFIGGQLRKVFKKLRVDLTSFLILDVIRVVGGLKKSLS
jgi:hypothetical protein